MASTSYARFSFKKTLGLTLLALPALYFNPLTIEDSWACKCTGQINSAKNQIQSTIKSESKSIQGELKNQGTLNRQLLDQTRREIIHALGQSVTGINSSISENTKQSSSDRAASDKFEQIQDIVNQRPQNINCGSAGSGAAPITASTKGSGGGSSYKGVKGGGDGGTSKELAINGLNKAQKAAGLTNDSPRAKDVDPKDKTEALVGHGLCSSFIASGTILGDMCKDSGASVSDNKYAGAHIDGGTLLDGPQTKDSKKKIKRNSIVENSDEHQAMVTNMQMLFETKAPPVLSENALNTNAGQSFLGATNMWLAAKNLARGTAEKIISQSMVDDSTKAALKYVQEEDGEWLDAYLSELEWDAKKGVSVSLMRDIEVDRRGANPDWTTSVPDMTDAERASEALYMQAKSLQLQRDILESLDRTNLLLAKLVESDADKMYQRIEDLKERALAEIATRGKSSVSEGSGD